MPYFLFMTPIGEAGGNFPENVVLLATDARAVRST